MSVPGILIDERFRGHDTGTYHPESPQRLDAIQKALESFEDGRGWRRIEPYPAAAEQLEWIHSRDHIDRVRLAALQAPVRLDPDTPVSAGSYDAALLASGGVFACLDSILAGDIDSAFAFVRPPGHHAEFDRAMGFCLFNNIALGAAYLRMRYGIKRVAIVDFDVHHGNGTQSSFFEDPGVLYISTHQYPFYPGTGAFQETGAGEGFGYTLNFPLPAGTGDTTFVPVYSRIVASVLDQFEPEFILVSAGFDALKADPLGGLAVSVEGLASAAASLLKSARRCCGGRICFVLEGGYSLAGIEECVCAVLTEMASDEPKELQLQGNSLFSIISKNAEWEFGEHWRW